MKQFTRRTRRLTAAQKKLVSVAGFDPRNYLFEGENEWYLYIVDKTTGNPAEAIRKSDKEARIP